MITDSGEAEIPLCDNLNPHTSHSVNGRVCWGMDPYEEVVDTLPQWLAWRFGNLATTGSGWPEGISTDDVSYWQHEAAAVRRAVERSGFKDYPYETP